MDPKNSVIKGLHCIYVSYALGSCIQDQGVLFLVCEHMYAFNKP